jgi:hypothetical protein
MSERLRHLQRQRALLGEHLTWIDSEIARETSTALNCPQPADKPASAPLIAPAPQAELVSDSAETLIEKYADEERQNPNAIRRGCLIVFTLSLALIAAGVATVWILFYR